MRLSHSAVGLIERENTFKVFFHLPTDAQLNCLKNNFKIYIKIDIKTANFQVHIVHLDTIKVFHFPTDTQFNCLKNNFKIVTNFRIVEF
jgi:hypothetical protein